MIGIILYHFRMGAVIYFTSRGKGAFALRGSLKVLLGTICTLRRNPDNDFGESACCAAKIVLRNCSLHGLTI